MCDGSIMAVCLFLCFPIAMRAPSAFVITFLHLFEFWCKTQDDEEYIDIKLLDMNAQNPCSTFCVPKFKIVFLYLVPHNKLSVYLRFVILGIC